MLLLNFSHPLTEANLAQLAELLGEAPPVPINRMPQFDHGRSLAEQAAELADSVGLSPTEWQTAPILINPPGHALITAALLAELHGRMGHFPTVIRLRPVAGAVTPQFEVAEVVNLQVVREAARGKRHLSADSSRDES